ncbi:TetR/AcrR family transcriptional regulator [Rhodococcus sp. 24CO]|uniref:TetR/AcrR family transcriptional regulator n=1 Tax=Rhodococcus sp. 24CO TaxID=3117460 RepID=UPI003D350B58
MTSPRRIGAPDAKNRALLLDAAEQVMLEEGYAAVSSRRIAKKAGLKPPLVYYYFRTMDDLFLELFRRRATEGLERQAELLKSPQPLRALWEFSIAAEGTAFTMEFVALANHRKVIRAEIADYSERFRAAQLETMGNVLQEYGIDPKTCPPAAALVLITSLSRVLVMEESLGVFGGHAETFALVEEYLVRLEGERLDDTN